MDTLHRTQVLLAPKNVRYISARANQEGLSMSEVIRQILDDAEAREPVAIESVWAMVGIGIEESALIGDAAVSENTDLYLVEAISPKSVRKSRSPRQRKARSQSARSL
jgi:hypothetical protein